MKKNCHFKLGIKNLYWDIISSNPINEYLRHNISNEALSLIIKFHVWNYSPYVMLDISIWASKVWFSADKPQFQKVRHMVQYIHKAALVGQTNAGLLVAWWRVR
jgi:hypothetical protein